MKCNCIGKAVASAVKGALDPTDMPKLDMVRVIFRIDQGRSINSTVKSDRIVWYTDANYT